MWNKDMFNMTCGGYFTYIHFSQTSKGWPGDCCQISWAGFVLQCDNTWGVTISSNLITRQYSAPVVQQQL